MNVGRYWLLSERAISIMNWKEIGHGQIEIASRRLPQAPDENREKPQSEQQVPWPTSLG
jgi:hypothetical protein